MCWFIKTNFSTALEEVPTANEEQFSLVYPTINTGAATLELDLTEAASEVMLSIFNAQGQLLRQQRLGKLSSGKSAEALDLSFLKNKGLYWLEIQAGQKKNTHAIILK